MTQRIFYACEAEELSEESVVKDSLTVQSEGKNKVSGNVPADQFRGVTKLIAYGKGGGREIDGEATQ